MDIWQDSVPAVLHRDGTELVCGRVHSDRSERRPLRRGMSRSHVNGLPDTKTGVVGVGWNLGLVPGRRHSGLPLCQHGLLYMLFAFIIRPHHEMRTIATDVPVAWCIRLSRACALQKRLNGSKWRPLMGPETLY